MPLPSIHNTKQFLTIRLLPPHQFLRKLLENSRRHIQSSASLPSHLLRYTSIKHFIFKCDCCTTAIHQQCQTIPHHQAIASTSILTKMHENLRRYIQSSTSLPSHIHPKLHINQTLPFRMQLQCCCHPSTMPNNSLPSGYCLHMNSCKKLLENSCRHIQSSMRLPSHLPKHTSIKHCHLGCNCGTAAINRQCQTIPHHQAMASTSILAKKLGKLRRHIKSSTRLPLHLLKYTSIKHCHSKCDCGAAAIHQQCQTIPHHQAIASTSILAKMARELVKIHPIKCEPYLTPPKTQINKKSPFQMRLQCRCHPPTMPNNSSPSGYCLYINSCGNCSRNIQSSMSLPSHLPKHTSIKHHHFECDCGAAAIHRQRQTIAHQQVIASTSILAEIS